MNSSLPPSNRADLIFGAAMELPPEEREAYVVSACGEDAGLLADVRSLLAVNATVPARFLDTPAAEAIANEESAAAAEPSREEQLFDLVLEKPPSQRARLLKVLCGEDEALRRRIEALLKARNPPDPFMGGASSAKATLRVEMEDKPSAEDVEGLTIGRYKLLQKIGEGGCGVVYMAEQTEPVRRRVALKVIKPGMDTKAVIARFEAERQALALMDHPNIAKVLDAGSTESPLTSSLSPDGGEGARRPGEGVLGAGRPYFVMELVRGIRFTEYCNQNSLGTHTRLELFIQICQAIQHAHQKGIIHRDIKPSNILVTLHDGVPVPKVIDFGIAKATTGQQLTDKTLFTAFEQFIGTPAYMSPEQAEMSGLDIDTRSDIYSLGVLLYELLTGKTPFDPKDLMECGLDAMRKTIREKEPVKPSTKVRTLRGKELTTTAKHHGVDALKLVSQLRGDLDWIVMKCLEKDRTRRYATANGLAMDIKRHLNMEPVVARPPSKLYVFQKTVRRHKFGFAATAAVIVVLAAGIVMTTWQAVRATHARANEAIQRQKAEANEQRATKMRARAEAEAERATQASTRALALARHLRVETYAADMRAADAALDENNRGSALGLLKRYFPKPGETDLRGIEWRYLWQKCRGDQIKTFAHDDIVNEAVFSPDSRFVATSCFDGLTRIWNVTTGKVVAHFEGHYFKVPYHPLAFSPDGRMLACCCPRSIVLRDTSNWHIVRQLTNVCWSAAFSPDGKHLAATSAEGVQLWDTSAWQNVLLKHQLYAWQGYLAFSPDSRLLAATTRSQDIEIWDVSSQSEFATLSNSELHATSLAFAPGNRWLAAGDINGLLAIWDLETKELVFTNKLHASFLMGLAFSPDGRTLATGGGDQFIHLWRWQSTPSGPPTLEELRTLQGHYNEVWSLDFSRDGRFLVSGSKGGRAMLWSSAPEQRQTLTWNPQTNQKLLGFSSDGKLLYSGAFPRDGQARIWFWNSENLERVGSLVLPPESRAFLVHDDRVWYGTTNGTIAEMDLRTGRAGKTIHIGGGRVFPVRVSPDQREALFWNADHSVASLWNLETDARLITFPDYRGQISAASFSPDGRYLAYPTVKFQVKLWNIPERRDQLTINAHRWLVNVVVFSPDEKLLATGSADGTVKLWDVATGKQTVPTLIGHLDGPEFALFSPDSRTLVTGNDFRSLRFWNVATGKEMITRQIGGRCFLSPDGNTIILSGAREGLAGSQIIRLPSLAEIDGREKADQLSENSSAATVLGGPSANVRPAAQ